MTKLSTGIVPGILPWWFLRDIERPIHNIFLCQIPECGGQGERKFHLCGIVLCFFFVGVSISSLKHCITGHSYMHALVSFCKYSWHKCMY